MEQGINVLALVKGEERYVFLYDDASTAETLRVLRRFASNPELSFTYYDAAVLSKKIRQEAQKNAFGIRFTLPQTTDERDIGRNYDDVKDEWDNRKWDNDGLDSHLD